MANVEKRKQNFITDLGHKIAGGDRKAAPVVPQQTPTPPAHSITPRPPPAQNKPKGEEKCKFYNYFKK